MSQIILDHVSKRYGDGTEAVLDVSLTVADGEFFVLVGPSGCGKSTLLSMIAGLEEITSGEIRVDGRVVNDVDPKDRNMAMVFQSYAVYPHMTVGENLAFPLRLARRPAAEIERRVRRVAQTLRLEEQLQRRPGQLSGGQRQRVAIGRAMVREPRAFLMDEPLSNLDAQLRAEMRTEIARLQKQLGATMVYVTHDQTEAMTLGDRVAVLSGGVVQQVGTPRELYDEPANLFVAGFIGSPPMNLLPIIVEGGRVRLPMGDFELPAEWRERMGAGRRELVAGIRPEGFRLALSSAGASAGAIVFPAVVDVVEWVGSELLVYFDMASNREKLALATARDDEMCVATESRSLLAARLAPTDMVHEGTEIMVEMNLTRVHLFDAAEGGRLTRKY
jgi:multiple sugar transport system ATP-binding protein